ncbi:unnamed protein product [Brachionus calyciflorus]|uniref:Potassium channel domain-containing protein n=1 Tax=Brachionus calyciflorus TaxID=104777 RepID=A0A814DNS1_9BILA|nr:unnamed protein product [Brachionus calyciflorus]
MDDNFSNFSVKRQNIRTLSLVVCTLIYLLTGAAVFDSLESPTEDKNRRILLNQIEKFRNNFNMSDVEFERLYKHMIKKGNFNRNSQWEFGGSFYFCTLALALIGYGHSTPNTTIGKLFCIIYILIGIPISLIMFQSVGERLNGFLKYSIKILKTTKIKNFQFKNKSVSNKDLIVAESFLTFVLVLTASYIFSVYEGWSYFDAIYYSFITLTTIGFGDYVPLQKHYYLRKNPIYAAFTILFIMTGLTILASSTNLLVLYLVNINSEEKLRKRMRLKQKKQEQLQKMLIGDVISSVNKQDIVTYLDEMPNLAALTEEKSVCSCDDLLMCYKACTSKVKFESRNFFKRKKSGISKNKRKHSFFLSNKQKSVSKMENLRQHFDSERRSDDDVIVVQSWIDVKNIRKFANEQSFHMNGFIMRRTSC